MSSLREEPLIPLSAAEMLYVVLDTARQSGQLDERTKENVGLILQTYRVRVKAAITPRGYDDVDVRHYTEGAAEALANWLEDRADKQEKIADDDDFAAFERQFKDEQQAKDQDSPTDTYWKHAGQGDDGAGGVDSSFPEGGGRDPDGGSPDPGAAGVE